MCPYVAVTCPYISKPPPDDEQSHHPAAHTPPTSLNLLVVAKSWLHMCFVDTSLADWGFQYHDSQHMFHFPTIIPQKIITQVSLIAITSRSGFISRFLEYINKPESCGNLDTSKFWWAFSPVLTLAFNGWMCILITSILHTIIAELSSPN